MTDHPGEAAFQRVTGLGADAVARLRPYADVLIKWQKRINLVGPATIDDLWVRHMADSAQLMPLLAAHGPGVDRPTILDIGTGAGFPGLVLALLGAGEVHLVDSDQRKCAFLRQVQRACGAEATVHAQRIEALAPFPADIVTARACAPLERLVAWAAPFLAPTTQLWFLKGRDAERELTRLAESWTVECQRFVSRTDDAASILRLTQVEKR